MDRMRVDVEGYYLDGRTASRQRAVVRPTRMGLQVETEKGATFFWPYEEIRWSGAASPDGQMRVERGGDIPEVLLVSARQFMQAVRFAAPEQARRFGRRVVRGSRLLKILGSAVGAGIVLLAFYLWGIPALAALIAPHVPVKWEENLGQGVVEYFAPRERQCQDPVRTQAIHKIMDRLNASASNNRYTFRVIVVNDPMVNALAAPGGYILIFRGLLERTGTPEELAGVLAHEMQHVLHGHATRQILQQASINVLLAAVTGDASEAMSYGLGAASTLGMLRYSRQYEEEADREAIRLLAASRIDPMGLARFFETMKKKDAFSGKIPAYLSTHPNLDERIARVKILADQSGTTPARLLQDYNWREISNICGKTAPKPNP